MFPAGTTMLSGVGQHPHGCLLNARTRRRSAAATAGAAAAASSAAAAAAGRACSINFCYGGSVVLAGVAGSWHVAVHVVCGWLGRVPAASPVGSACAAAAALVAAANVSAAVAAVSAAASLRDAGFPHDESVVFSGIARPPLGLRCLRRPARAASATVAVPDAAATASSEAATAALATASAAAAEHLRLDGIVNGRPALWPERVCG
mmetsp:Transcript_54952/g.159062  ORF Transcript_54952/g.159062 Transcript_54952/m.159062 type:complete len:206 (+) Transcript_54952:140-757(+)